MHLRSVLRTRGPIGMIGAWALGATLACESPPTAPPASQSAESKAEASPPTAAAGSRWLKGQLHLHSSASGDSQTPPEDVARWYAEHGYDFIVFTDHNRITEIPAPEGLLVFRGIELTQNLERCEPAPEPGMACLLHVNGLFVGTNTDALAAVPQPAGDQRVELYAHAMAATEALGGIAMLNHPNFHYAADREVMGQLSRRGLTLIELANEAVDSNNEGDARHPSVEENWDTVLSSGARVWGVATDDAHHYYDADEVRERGELAHVGERGWIMVRSDETAPATQGSIRAAIERGDFYSTNGVLLERIDVEGRAIEVAVPPGGSATFEFIGRGGRVLDTQKGTTARFEAAPSDDGYVRVRVQDDQGRRAWTQPHWLP